MPVVQVCNIGVGIIAEDIIFPDGPFMNLRKKLSEALLNDEGPYTRGPGISVAASLPMP